ncbi:hypothetical protein N7510_002422 [Penicillium lagena]|uniref:uncharacterized protein n=1 Tax=Penicillium lagena TaxID=94218 RepID=UPI0025405AC3|nr:uncharacterized protein N7510_002422 [Penicillium lagena]KAJ5626113.1 hypothetical protein N7510_002422 [Penicillium lagena]
MTHGSLRSSSRASYWSSGRRSLVRAPRVSLTNPHRIHLDPLSCDLYPAANCAVFPIDFVCPAVPGQGHWIRATSDGSLFDQDRGAQSKSFLATISDIRLWARNQAENPVRAELTEHLSLRPSPRIGPDIKSAALIDTDYQFSSL